MRKYLLYSVVLLVALSVGFSSCDNDDEIDNRLVGRWQLVETTDEFAESCDFRGWLEFRSDGTYTDFDACENQTISGTWSVDGNRLRMVFYQYIIPIPITLTIVSISDSELALRVSILGQTQTTTWRRIN